MLLMYFANTNLINNTLSFIEHLVLERNLLLSKTTCTLFSYYLYNHILSNHNLKHELYHIGAQEKYLYLNDNMLRTLGAQGISI